MEGADPLLSGCRAGGEGERLRKDQCLFEGMRWVFEGFPGKFGGVSDEVGL